MGSSIPTFRLRRLSLLKVFFCIPMLWGCSLDGYGARDDEMVRPRYYTVQAGDNLFRIGKRFGISVDRIVSLNGLRTSSELNAGDRLLIGYLAENGESRRVRSTRADRSVTPQRTNDNGGAQLQRARAFVPPKGARLLWPVNGGDIVSVFGLRGGSFHDGLDIAAPRGTEVYAAENGVVAYAGSELGGYGKLVIIRGDGGLLSVYGHNDRLLIRQGARVQRGQLIAKVGETGRASGPHLHFEVRMKDPRGRYVAVDPLPLLQGGQLPRLRYRVNESLTPLLAKLGIW